LVRGAARPKKESRHDFPEVDGVVRFGEIQARKLEIWVHPGGSPEGAAFY